MSIRLIVNCLTQSQTLLKQATIKSIVRTSVNLSFKVIGEGTTEPEEPPIFLLHGLLASKKEWKGIGKTILNMTKRTVVVLDLRNHGGSPHVNSQRYDEMAADMVQLLDKLHVKRASLVGHNIGGRMAMCTALIAPKRVAGLLVVDISPSSTPKHLNSMFKLLLAMNAVKFNNPKTVSYAKREAKRQLKLTVDKKQEGVVDDTILSSVLSNIMVLNEGKIGWKCNLDVLIKQFPSLETFPMEMMKGKKYDGPCLFIGGQMSEYIPADDLNSILGLFPKAVITYIPKATHNLHAQDTRLFLEIAIDFLKSHH